MKNRRPSVHERLASGLITREQWDNAVEAAHVMWDRCGFPRVRIGRTKAIPGGALGLQFEKLRNYFIDNPVSAT